MIQPQGSVGNWHIFLDFFAMERDQQIPESGNASNPSPDQHSDSGNQHLDKKAETYLREVANIEDVPDADELKEAEDEMNNNEE